jgi:hypothetical protein
MGKTKFKYEKLPKGQPCKPCWELKYCPYGPLVEFFPLLDAAKPDSISSVKRMHRDAIKACFAARTKRELYQAVDFLLFSEPHKWSGVAKYDPEEVSCNVFGHVCPVFLEAEALTETRAGRTSGRHVSREVMLKVVRRDNYVCQRCGERVPDNEIEFDHIIPYSKGGPTTADNLRLLYRACNRNKSDSLHELLWIKRGSGLEALWQDEVSAKGETTESTPTFTDEVVIRKSPKRRTKIPRY